jgi:glycosyltransferase involved in cell wall biosynthesis
VSCLESPSSLEVIAPTRPKYKVLIVTDSAVLPSGMAETTRLIFEGLLDRYPGFYELHQIGLSHCYAVTQPRWPIYPTQAAIGPNQEENFAPEDRYAQRSFGKWVAKLRPHVVFAFGDPQKVAHLCLPASQRQHRLILYLNFDGLPGLPDQWPRLNHADLILGTSEFSRDVLAHSLPDMDPAKLDYLYSPADTARFSPILDAAKAELRRDLFPGWMQRSAFVMGWIGRNQWRKQVWVPYKILHYLRTGQYLVCPNCERVSLLDWDPVLRAHGTVATRAKENRPSYNFQTCAHCRSPAALKAEPLEDVILWLHMAEEPGEDWPVRRLEEQFALSRERDIFYTEGFGLKSALSPADVPALYNLWDCLLYLSGGEGFGLPAWEAMCSGLPLIYTNYSAHAELVGRAHAGLGVGGILQPERKSCIWRMIADVPQVIEAVRKLYFNRDLGCRLGCNGRQFAEQYRLEIQVERWHRIFQKILAGRQIVSVSPSTAL